MTDGAEFFELYDYRVRVDSMYRARNDALRRGEEPLSVWKSFRSTRDELFARHPQSALDDAQRATFQRLEYFPYNVDARMDGTLTLDDSASSTMIGTSGADSVPMSSVGRIEFEFKGHRCALTLYWIDVYGGGFFLPFRDRTAPHDTYGGGRYLVDTVKGSDFPGMVRTDHGARVALDFNYAYNPSCAYHYRWACPLAPVENHLAVQMQAGERTFVAARHPR